MKFSELKEMIENKTFSIDKINIKKYVDVLTKKAIVLKVIDDATRYENDIVYIDFLNKEVGYDWSLMLYYTDIEIDTEEDMISIYDYLKENDIFGLINGYIGEDAYILNCALDEEINNIKLRNNTLEAIVSKGMAKLVDILDKNTNPKAIKGIIKEAQKLDLDKLPAIKQLVDTLNNKQK